MNWYNKYILPKYLDLVMKNKDLKQHRQDVVSKLSGRGLEIGFGSGLNLPYYKNISHLYALEPATELYALGNEAIRNADFTIEHLKNSAEHISLPDNSLDFVVSTWTLCSIPQVNTALMEIYRVLKPGGTLTFIEHGKSPKNLVSHIQNILTPASKVVAGGCHLNRDIEQLIIDANFQIQKLEKFSQLGKPLAYMYKGTATAIK